jgi:serine/threonine protein kinase
MKFKNWKSVQAHAMFQVLKKELSPEEVSSFMREAAIMAQVRHPNVVSLVGVCTAGAPKMLVMQFCEHGSLLSFLQRHFGFSELQLRSKLKIMDDVAFGMKFLSGLLIVHRDLAARNILVGADYICKVL